MNRPLFESKWYFYFSCVSLVFVWLSAQVVPQVTFQLFVFFSLVVAVCNIPKSIISPKVFFIMFYLLWYVLAPSLAYRYADKLVEPIYALAICLIYSSYIVGIMALSYGEGRAAVLERRPGKSDRSILDIQRVGLLIGGLYLLSTMMNVLVVTLTGGFALWIANPGYAFLHRAGSGVFVVLSHFFTLVLALLTGALSYAKAIRWPIWLFLMWLLIMSPVFNGKFVISLFILILFIPWLRETNILSLNTAKLGGLLVFACILGFWFRGAGIDRALWNYFSTLDNLVLSIRDFHPGFLTTFFLPFNKFKTPFGLSDPKMYYDMSHFLTDYYYPWRWAIRATEQWPIETDLYLNFYFVLGLPLLMLYLGGVGYLYGKAIHSGSIGYWFSSVMLSASLISHLRGGLYNYIDFYMYPYILLVWFFFRKYYFEAKT